MTSRAAKRQKGDDGQPIITPAPAPAKEPVIEDPSSSSDDDDETDSSKMPKVAPRNLIKNWAMVQAHADFPKFKAENPALVEYVERNVSQGPVWDGNGRNDNKILRGVYYAVCYKV